MTELTQILKNTVNQLLKDHVSHRVLESSENGNFPHKLWDALEENGLTQPLVSEGNGGAGALFTEVYEIIYGAGYYAAPVPLIETILASWLAEKTGLPIPKGPISVLENRPNNAPKLFRSASEWFLSGAAPQTPWGKEAKGALVITNGEGALRAALVQTCRASVTADFNMAREPRDTVIFEKTPINAISEPLNYEISKDVIKLYGAMFRAAQIAGASQRALDLSIEYARERRAFGQTIGKFQAVQHQLAKLAARVAQAAMAAESAFRTADYGDPRFQISVAKIVAGQTATLATETVHQVFAAIGFTYDHILNFLTRRLWCWRAEYGSDNHWAEQLGRRAAGRGPDMLWSDLTGHNN